MFKIGLRLWVNPRRNLATMEDALKLTSREIDSYLHSQSFIALTPKPSARRTAKDVRSQIRH